MFVMKKFGLHALLVIMIANFGSSTFFLLVMINIGSFALFLRLFCVVGACCDQPLISHVIEHYHGQSMLVQVVFGCNDQLWFFSVLVLEMAII